MHYILLEWLDISHLLATNIEKPSRDSRIERPALEGLSIVFLCKEFPKPQLTLSSPGCCAMGHSNTRTPTGGGKYLYKQRHRLPEPEHNIFKPLTTSGDKHLAGSVYTALIPASKWCSHHLMWSVLRGGQWEEGTELSDLLEDLCLRNRRQCRALANSHARAGLERKDGAFVATNTHFRVFSSQKGMQSGLTNIANEA